MDFAALREKVVSKVKNFYYFFEDKWYAVLDKLDKHIPVYKVVDPIDRIIPSFVLFLILILFLLILAGYLVRFAAPYEVTFTTLDAATHKSLPAVKLSGTLNEEIFQELTNSDGQATLTVQGASRNFFEAVWQLLFPLQEYPIAIVSAEKTGYVPIKKQEIEFDSAEYRLSLQPVVDSNGGGYGSSTTVLLVDAETGDAIVDNANEAYVKFRCSNKTITTKTVRDDADGETDGSFQLNEPTCGFVMVSAFSPGYERLNVSQDLAAGTNRIELSRIAAPNEGMAKVYVYEKNSSPKKYLGNIEVVLNGTGTTSTAITDASGVATKNLYPGTYSITITDENYYEITPDQNVGIAITKGETTEIEIALEYKPATSNRVVFFKVIDAADNNTLANVNVELMWLNLDSNGNYFGATTTDVLNYALGAPTATDSTGQYRRTGFSDRSGGLMAVLSKAGYVYKIFKPQLFIPGNGPETVTMEKATSLNSGSAKINVAALDTNKPIAGAQAFLYTDFLLDSKIIKNVKISRAGILTSSAGQSLYTGLPKGTYSASALFDDVFSGITPIKVLDVNQQITFDVKINLSVAYIEVVPIDADTSAFVSNATVKLYVVNNWDSMDKTFSETLGYKSVGSSPIYQSAGYAKGSSLWITIDANSGGYVPNSIAIQGSQESPKLSPGANKYYVKMRKCAPNEDVNIFFAKEDVYAKGDDVWAGVSSAAVLSKGGTYYAKIDAVLCKSISYSELMALSRLSGPAKMENIDFYPPYNTSADLYTADTNSMDSQPSPHNDSYYLPSKVGAFNRASPAPNIQSGADWNAMNNVLPPGTYPFVIKFKINSDANEESDRLFVSFRAKEKHSSTASETPLKQVELDLNRPIMNGVFFSITMNNGSPFTLSSNQVSSQVKLAPESANSMQVKLINNTIQSLANGTLTVYSLQGSSKNFVSGMAGNGGIFFDSSTGPQKKDIGTGVSANPYTQTVNYPSADAASFLHPVKYNYTNYIVVEAKFPDQNSFFAFVNTKANGKTFNLDAEFLAGVMDQNFDGTIYPRSGDAALTVKTVHLTALRKCKDANVAFEIEVPTSHMSGANFYNQIDGIYEYMMDCVKVDITADSADNSYAPLSKTIYAGSGGALDPTLSCIEVTTPTGDTNASLDWGAQQQFIVTNKCQKDVTVKVDVGLVCAVGSGLSTSCSANWQSIDVGASKTYTITGKNVEYDPSAAKPNFTDVLGFYPLYVSGRYTDEATKKLVLVDKAEIHLYNSNQCFAISKDSFDFLTAPTNKIDFTVNSNCQYTLIGNYYIPKITLNSFGYDLNYPVTFSSAPVSFTPQLIITGQQYVTTNVSTEQTSVWSAITKSAGSLNSWDDASGNYKHYALSFNLADLNYPGSNVYKLQFEWSDLTNPLSGRDYPYGARIDSSIVVKYSDGTPSYSFSPRTNFVIDTYPPTCNPAHYSDIEYCEVGDSPGVQFYADENFSFGLLYFTVNAGKVSSIDFNVIGDKNSSYLAFRLVPTVVFTQTTQQVVPSPDGSSTTSTIDVGTFSIYPLEGVTFLVKSINDMSAFSDSAFLSITNPTVYLNSSNQQVLAWIESGYLKARFVGYDISQFNDGVLDMGITRSFGQGTGYGLITVVDYVSTEKAAGKTVSGA